MRLKDLTGQKFGRLTVLYRDYTRKSKKTYWWCECSCENKTIKSIEGYQLTTGKTKSCSCLQKEIAKTSSTLFIKKYNTYDLSGEYGIGYTSKGDYFYFDLDDYDKIKEYCWCKDKNGYFLANGIRMNRLVMNVTDKKIIVDHIFHNVYDNRKSKLREVTRSQNTMNSITPNTNKSGVKGVTWHKRDNIWDAQITVEGTQIYLGRFTNFEDAVKVRKDAEDKYCGEYSYDNSMNLNKDSNHEPNNFPNIP